MDSVIFFVSFISISAGAYVHVCVCSLVGEILHFSCDRVHFSGFVERIVVFFRCKFLFLYPPYKFHVIFGNLKFNVDFFYIPFHSIFGRHNDEINAINER